MLLVGQGFRTITSRVISITPWSTGSSRGAKSSKQSGQSGKNGSRSNIFDRFSPQRQKPNNPGGYGDTFLLESQGYPNDVSHGKPSSHSSSDEKADQIVDVRASNTRADERQL